jgi:hypothetical protein
MHLRKFSVIDLWPLLSDQTPTPTRFLKNCEEVGLFSELDCSFEHEFRKAQEEENSKRVGGPGWTPEVCRPARCGVCLPLQSVLNCSQISRKDPAKSFRLLLTILVTWSPRQ